MPSAAWREAFSQMWNDVDDVAVGALEDAIRLSKVEARGKFARLAPRRASRSRASDVSEQT